MEKQLYILSLFLTIIVSGVKAQESHIKGIKFENQYAGIKGGKLSVRMDLYIATTRIPTTQMVILVPSIVSADNSRTMELPAIIINGKNRHKAYIRAQKLKRNSPYGGEIKEAVKRDKKQLQTISYVHELPAEGWMHDSELIMKEVVTGCADCDISKNDILLSKVEKPFIPSYAVTYIKPDVEPVKARSGSHSASFNYKVGRHELLRNFGNNAKELAEVNRIITDVKSNKDISITQFTVSGYSSPEGNFNSNLSLSANRANSFAHYLGNTYEIESSRLKIEGFGEDWTGLVKAVAASSLGDKGAILKIVDNLSDADARDAALKKLSGGETYRELLTQYYPPLRRTDYTISYNVRAFSVEEAREIIKTNPKLLSLNEMYLVAQSYPATSKEFKDVFDIAARLYPGDPVAIVNSASVDIEGGNYRAAINRLLKIETAPCTWNNLGVAYAHAGDTDKARHYFDRAAAKGDACAIKNLEQMNKSEQH